MGNFSQPVRSGIGLLVNLSLGANFALLTSNLTTFGRFSDLTEPGFYERKDVKIIDSSNSSPSSLTSCFYYSGWSFFKNVLQKATFYQIITSDKHKPSNTMLLKKTQLYYLTKLFLKTAEEQSKLGHFVKFSCEIREFFAFPFVKFVTFLNFDLQRRGKFSHLDQLLQIVFHYRNEGQ